MGYLEGFTRHVPPDRSSARVTDRTYPRRRSGAEGRAPPRPPRPQPLRGRHGEVHRLRAVRRRVPGAVHLRARRRQPARRPGVARRALRLRLRDQLPALHPLRPVRRGVPDRGDHRDEAVRVLVHQPAATRSTPRTSCSSTTTAGRSSCRGRTGATARTTHTSALDAGDVAVAATPTSRAASAGRASSATACAPPEQGQTRRRRTPTPSRRRARRRATAGALMDAVVFFVCAARSCSSARSASCSRATRCTPRCSLVHDAVRHRRAVRRPGRPVPRRGAGHRLRRRDRRAVPVRDHAARRRPRRGPRASTRCRASARPPSSLGCRHGRPAARRVFVAARAAVTGAKSVERRRSTATSRTSSRSARSLFTDYVFAFELTVACCSSSRSSAPSCSPGAPQRPPCADDDEQRGGRAA